MKSVLLIFIQRLLFTALVQGPLNCLTALFIETLEPVMIRRLQVEQLSACVIAIAYMPPVIHSSPQHHVTKLAVLHWPERGCFQPVLEQADVQNRQGELAAVKIAPGRTDQTTDQRPGAQR